MATADGAGPAPDAETTSDTSHGALQSNEVLSDEVQRNRGLTLQDGEPQREPEPRPDLEGMTREELVAVAWAEPETVEAVRAEVARRAASTSETLLRFGEGEPAAVTDTDVHLWRRKAGAG